ncbi:single-stranded DNA-binding protein [Streptomyces sp. N2-109]|uniref:Single-stranded DNA-binding protein n=1 Tax=Streptomyces gossypii TaxID=2883101 RepID=A0ABT2JRJ6_9ACTN|nr:single-stranded DNA-binding protein [Streptomyces gossypii]MCT2590517.1 single-stranded DNA-binding protein [Streptomyces gossypii]
MYEAHVTVVGNAATQVEFRTTDAGLPFAWFRLASTVRRFDRARGGWADSYSSFYTVWARRSLAANLSSSVTIGEPLIVQGQLRVREGSREGRESASVDLLASAIGHDLSRGTSAFVRVSRATPGLTPDGSGERRRHPVAEVPTEARGAPEAPEAPEAKVPDLLTPS